MVGAEVDVKVTWNNDIEYRRKRRNMKKQVLMMNRESKEQDEEYSRTIVESVEMKLLVGLLGGNDEDETLIYRLKYDTFDISISWY